MEITSENHICNSAENIYDHLTRGKKVEMEARSLIEQRRLGIRIGGLSLVVLSD